MKTVLMLADQVCETFMRIKAKKYCCLVLTIINYLTIISEKKLEYYNLYNPWG